jgi:hypothetical protein
LQIIAEETLFSYQFLHIVKAFDSQASDVGFLDLQKCITASAQALHSKRKQNENKKQTKTKPDTKGTQMTGAPARSSCPPCRRCADQLPAKE